MLKVENTETWGFEHAIRGMRNPMNSWDKSDSVFTTAYKPIIVIGKNDLELMQKLYKAGTEHRKYLRQIFVSMDITAPLYWWLEMDTYKIGVICDSCSKMHTLHKRDLTLEDFSCEHMMKPSVDMLEKLIDTINVFRHLYNDGDNKHKQFWYNMIQLLPESYNQKRTVTMNYENVFSIIKQRSGHKLDEWNDFVDILKELPYVKEIGGF